MQFPKSLVWRALASNRSHVFRKPILQSIDRYKNLNKFGYQYSTCPGGMKVTICGAAGCTGM